MDISQMFGLSRSFQLNPCASKNERFQKKAGGASAELAPVGAQLVTAADPLAANAMTTVTSVLCNMFVWRESAKGAQTQGVPLLYGFSGDRMPSMHPQEMQTAILEMKAIPEAPIKIHHKS